MSYKFILLLGLCCYAKAQDTIYKRTGECFAAKVIEIGLTEVRFRRADNPEGPLFIYNKNDIKRIRYASGAVDTFAVTRRNAAPAPVYTQKGLPAFNYNRVEPSGRSCIFIYRGRSLSDHGLINLSLDRNEAWHDSQISAEISNTRESKLIQYTTGFGGMGIGILSFGAIASSSSSNPGFLAGASLLTIGLVVAAEVVSVHFKIERGRHARRLAALYNAHL